MRLSVADTVATGSIITAPAVQVTQDPPLGALRSAAHAVRLGRWGMRPPYPPCPVIMSAPSTGNIASAWSVIADSPRPRNVTKSLPERGRRSLLGVTAGAPAPQSHEDPRVQPRREHPRPGAPRDRPPARSRPSAGRVRRRRDRARRVRPARPGRHRRGDPRRRGPARRRHGHLPPGQGRDLQLPADHGADRPPRRRLARHLVPRGRRRQPAGGPGGARRGRRRPDPRRVRPIPTATAHLSLQ